MASKEDEQAGVAHALLRASVAEQTDRHQSAEGSEAKLRNSFHDYGRLRAIQIFVKNRNET